MIVPYGKKEIELFHVGHLVKAKMVGGGELPQALSGMWTNMAFAERDIKIYDKNRPNGSGKIKIKLNKEDYRRD